MKKVEAMQIAPQRSQLLIEYIMQILSDSNQVCGEILIDSAKINNEKMCTLEIFVPQANFEKHLNIGIPVQQVDVLIEACLEDIAALALESNNILVSPLKYLHSMLSGEKWWIDITGDNDNKIELNFVCRGLKIRAQSENYNSKIEEIYKNKQTNTRSK